MQSRRSVLSELAGLAVGLASGDALAQQAGGRMWRSQAELVSPVAHFIEGGGFWFGTMNGMPQAWVAHNAGRPYSCQLELGGKILRLELRPGEQWSGDTMRHAPVERTLVQAITDTKSFHSEVLPLAADIWWGFSFLVEPGAPVTALGVGYDWLVFADIHCNNATTHAITVPITFEIAPGDFLTFQTHGDFFPSHRHNVYRSPQPLRRGVWYDLVMKINMDPSNASGHGGLNVWLDGQQIYTYAGPLGFANDLPYAQFQIYRGSPDPQTIQHETLAVRYANDEMRTEGTLAARIGSPPVHPGASRGIPD